MEIKPTTTSWNACEKNSAFDCEPREHAHISGDDDDGQAMEGVAVFEGRFCDLEQRAVILEAEERRLAGETTYSVSEARAMLKERYVRA